MIHLGGGLLQQVPVSQGERVGVHHHHSASAFPAEGAEIVTVLLQSPAVFQQDGQRSSRQKAEAQALEHRLVFRLGENLEVLAGTLAQDSGHQGNQQALGADLRRNRQAFEHVPGHAGAGQNSPCIIRKGIIRIKRFHSEPVGFEEPLYLITEVRRTQWYLLYVA